jgi:hypothetical protein
VAGRLSQRGPFVPPADLTAILGCSAEELPALLSDMGYAERDGRFERRSRGPRKPGPGRAVPAGRWRSRS